MLKKLFSVLIVFSVIIGANVSAYAMEMNNVGDDQSHEIVIPIDASEEIVILDNSTDSATMSTVETARLGVSASRSGTTEKVKINLSYSGNVASNALRFKELIVANKSELVGVTYGKIGNGSTYKTYSTDASKLYYINVGTVNVPNYIDAVKITLKDAQVYCMNHYEWHSTIGAPKIVDIN